MYNPVDFYSYFKECYKLDYKEFTVENLLSAKYSYKWFATGKEELFNDDLPLTPYTNEKVSELEKDVELYKLEKKLFYACFFILGKNENSLSKDKRICAPLILFPATIKTINDDKFLEIDQADFIINQSILTKLETISDQLPKDLFLSELSEKIANDKNNLIGLKNLFDKYFSNINTDELLMFPKVWSVEKLRKHFTNKQLQDNEYEIVPAAGTVLIEKSESTLRVTNDLDEMAQMAEFNTCTKNLVKEQTQKRSFEFSYYKSRLNTDQYKALQNAYRYTNSVIVGPPGTGKTYTITSIISDAVIKNQSVLVVSKTKQAVEVLREMLEEEFHLKDYLIHTLGSRYKYSLQTKIRNYLNGIIFKENTDLNEPLLKQLFKNLEKQEEKFEKFIERELKKSDLEFNSNLNFFDKWKKIYLKSISLNGAKLWTHFHEIEQLLSELEHQIGSFSKRKIQNNIKNNSRTYRKDISLFYNALNATNFTSYKETLKTINQQNILKVFPVWLANLSELNSVLPLQPDMFDLVIIDEATQCDIASALPALFRAKRAIIAGDPNQLKHYSFVSQAQQTSLREKYNLPQDYIFDYRNRSILDLFISKVQNQEQVTFLREHFRSTPSLIEFSNQQFYEGQLEVLKSTPKHTTHKQLELVETNGTRNKKGVNEIEAMSVIAKLEELVETYETEKSPPSIGIISPFSTQVDFINKKIREKFDLVHLKKFNVLCGTPYNFQGSEREIILISFCVCDQTHPSAFVHANKPEVLNVAITRAKSYQYIFKSVSDQSLKQDSLLYQYFSFIRNFSHTGNTPIELDKFQEEVTTHLKQAHYDSVRCGYPLAGNLLDILVTHNGKNYFIDLIGYPGIFKEAFPIERYKTLTRTGVKSFPLHYSYWKNHKEKVVKKLTDLID